MYSCLFHVDLNFNSFLVNRDQQLYDYTKWKILFSGMLPRQLSIKITSGYFLTESDSSTSSCEMVLKKCCTIGANNHSHGSKSNINWALQDKLPALENCVEPPHLSKLFSWDVTSHISPLLCIFSVHLNCWTL